nr:type IV toxin-antitoxin system AbiEi family antitoxin domain-containing protein [Streptomyces sp. DSM 41633]
MDVGDVLRQQDGVISRRQALDAGLAEHEIRRLLRRNEWARVHVGVYVEHTGPPSWMQRAWAAVLYAAPAALCLESALTGEGAVIHVAVSRDRGVLAEPPGVRIHHLTHLQE